MDCVYVGALLGELIIHSGFCELPKLEVSQTGGGGGGSEERDGGE